MMIMISFIFLFGLLMGSFFSVCIQQAKQQQFSLWRRSHCDHCLHSLAWYDLIPLLSILLLKGQCRHCKKPISLRYPLLEFLTACLFTGVYFCYGKTTYSFVMLIAVSALVMLAIVDLDTMLIPDRFILILLGCGLFRLFIEPSQSHNAWISLFCPALFMAICAAGNKMGFGDVKLMAVSGLLLGWQKNIIAFFIGSICASLVVCWQMLAGKLTTESKIPFGPYLATGLFVVIFFGDFFVLQITTYLFPHI